MRQIRFRHLWIGLAIGLLIGLFAKGEFEIKCLIGIFSAVVALFLHLLIQYLYAVITGYFYDGRTFMEQEERFMDHILALAAEMSQIDGSVTESELDAIKKRLEHDLSAEKAELYFEKFKSFLKSENDLAKICKKIDREFDDASKQQLMYILISIAAADGILNKKEISLIQKIALACHIPSAIITQILAIFKFKFEGHSRNKSSGQSHSKQRPPGKSPRHSKLTGAYRILGIPENSDANSIKSAYRKLAKIHHPDKVVHMGPVFQKKAKEKFQIIVDAYDLIKSKKGF